MRAPSSKCRRTLKIWRKKNANPDVDIGTWDSTAPATWSSNPTAGSISIDEAPTPFPNSYGTSSFLFSPSPSLETPTTTSTHQASISHVTNTCRDCRITAATTTSTSAGTLVSDDASRRQQQQQQQHRPQVPLVIAVVTLSCLILVISLVLGWLRCRRRRGKLPQKQEELVEHACLHRASNVDDSSHDSVAGVAHVQEKKNNLAAQTRSTSSSPAGPSLLPDASSSTRRLLSPSDIVLPDRPGKRARGTRDPYPSFSSANTEDCHPAFFILPDDVDDDDDDDDDDDRDARDLPPTPPPKHRMIPPRAPPSSPTLSPRHGRSSGRAEQRPIPESPHVRALHELPSVSSRSDQIESPYVGLVGVGNH